MPPEPPVPTAITGTMLEVTVPIRFDLLQSCCDSRALAWLGDNDVYYGHQGKTCYR